MTSEQTSQLKSDLEARLAPYDQSHVLQYWDKLDPEAQEKLSDQIYGYDLEQLGQLFEHCLLYTSPSPRDATLSRMPSSA